MSVKAKPTRIQLIGEGRLEEGRAGVAIKPGMLVMIGTNGQVFPHNAPGAVAERAFALEDALRGKGIGDDYAAGDLVAYGVQVPGDVVYAWLGSSEVTTTGSFLTSNGDGTLKIASGSDIRIARALEVVDASDSSGKDERIRVRLI